MSDDLPATLRQALQTGAPQNPALDRLVDDFARYHLVLAVVGVVFVVGLVAVAGSCGWRLVRIRRRPGAGLEQVACVTLGLLSAGVAAFLALVVVGNVTNAMDPVAGLAGTIGDLSGRHGAHAAALHDAFADWLRSGQADVPALVRQAVDERLAWQRPKALVCTALLVGAVLLAVACWRSLFRPRPHARRRWLRTTALAAAGSSLVLASVLLMLMVMGNTQASVAPLVLTMLYG